MTIKSWTDKMMQELTKPTLKQKVTFFRLLSVSQNAGLGIRESIQSISKSEKHQGFKDIMDEMVIQLTNGGSLAEAMEPYSYFFSSDEIELVRSAQVTGNMAQVLTQLADELENIQEINQKMKKAMTYPTMVLLMAIGAVIVILTTVLPQILTMFPNQDKLPGITKFMMGVSDYLKHNYAVLI
ncbi:MAG: type II secretion system F family protein [bacterium]|nr:type II secretion system F family protein [bacterium]